MGDKIDLNAVANIAIIIALLLLAFFILKPVLLTVFFALILSFIFHPLYKKIQLRLKSKNLSAFIVCLLVIIIIVLPLFLLTPVIVKQIFRSYSSLQQIDIYSAIKKTISSVIDLPPEFYNNLGILLNDLTSQVTNYILNNLSNLLINFTKTIIYSLLIFFIFFFGLRDGDEFVEYLKKISPFSKKIEKKVFTQFKDITYAVIYGQIITGLTQGIITGIGLLIFGVPNALTLTFIAIIFGVLPIIGPTLVWIPVSIYLLLTGRILAGISIFLYGLFVISWVDNLIRPMVVSKRTQVNPAIVLIGMVGGFLVLGLLGLIFGPLILSYVILLLEFYREHRRI